MRLLLTFILASAVFICGCASVPDLPDESRVQISDVVERIRCEFSEAIALQPNYRDWVSKFTLTLQIEAKSNLSGSTVATLPIHFGTFKIGLESNLNRTTTRTASLTFSTIFNRTPKCLLPDERPEHLRAFFRSKIGLNEWLDRVSLSGLPLRVKRDTDRSPPMPAEVLKATDLGYSLDFVILFDGKINPSFSILRPSGYGVDGSASLQRSAEYMHKLEVAITPRDDLNAPGGPQHVCIVNTDAESKLGGCPDEKDHKELTKVRRKQARQFYRDRLTPVEEQRLDNTLLQLRLQNLRIRP
jgi:hypothetical protein